MPLLEEKKYLIINKLTSYLKTLENQEQIKFKANRRKEMKKNRVETDEIKNRKIDKINKIKSCFF